MIHAKKNQNRVMVAVIKPQVIPFFFHMTTEGAKMMNGYTMNEKPKIRKITKINKFPRDDAVKKISTENTIIVYISAHAALTKAARLLMRKFFTSVAFFF